MRHDEDWVPFCERWLAAWTGHRVDVLLRWYTEDCLYADPRCPLGVVGKAALRSHLEPLLARHPDWRCRLRFCSTTRTGVRAVWKIAFANDRLPARMASAELILRRGLILQQQSQLMMDDLHVDPGPDRLSNECHTRGQRPPWGCDS